MPTRAVSSLTLDQVEEMENQTSSDFIGIDYAINMNPQEKQNPYLYFTCGECKQKKRVFIFEGLVTSYKGSNVCADCRKDMNICHNCGRLFSEKGDFCPSCIKGSSVTCKECKEKFSKFKDTNFYVHNSYYYHRDCFDKVFATCIACSLVFPRLEMVSCEQCQGLICSQPDHYIFHLQRCRGGQESYEELVTFYKGTEPGKIVTVDRFVGVELEAEQGDWDKLADMDIPSDVDVDTDGSLHDRGVEVRTPPASLNKLESIIKNTTEGMRECGFRGTKAAGCHIHVDLRDIRKDNEKISQILRTFYAVEDIIYSMLPPSRWSNRYCQSLFLGYTFDSFKNKEIDKQWYKDENKTQVDRRKLEHGDSTRYSGLNLHSLFYRGTIEFRYHSGTVSPDKVLHWIQFVLKLVDYAINRFDESKIDNLFNMITSQYKFDMICKLIELDEPTTIYIQKRIGKFNPGFRVHFNKGQMEYDLFKNINLEKIAKEHEDNYVEEGAREFVEQCNYSQIDIEEVDSSDRDRWIKQYASRRSLSVVTNMIRKKSHNNSRFITKEEIEEAVEMILAGIELQKSSAGEVDLE